MISKITQTALRFPLLVIVALVTIVGVGITLYSRMPVDAFPDISPVMVPVFAEGHGMAPEEIERLITYPIESAMNGLPGVTQMKSTSAFGMAVIYVYFKDDMDIYFARQLVSERLSSAVAELPELDNPPALGPISTGLGQIFLYYLTIDEDADTEGKDPNTYLRELNDWVVKFQLQTVPGVTEILSIGGHVLQYQIKVNPNSLWKYGLTMEDLVNAVNDNNRNVGGQFLVLGSEEYLVRGLGLVENLDSIRNISIKEEEGRPVFLADVADVVYGNEIRRGVVSLNGEREVVSGIVLKLYGENTSDVIERLHRKVESVKEALPAGVHLKPYYEQSDLVNNATGTIKKALLEGAILVSLTLLLFLGNWRTALIVVLSLPLCAFLAIICMDFKDLSANLMSLGGIAVALGMLVDGAIVMVENIFRHLGLPANKNESKSTIILTAAKEVCRPIIFSIAIVIIVFLPIFTLQGIEGKMFSPMAFTISFALLGAIISALVMAPVLSLFLLKKEFHKELKVMHLLRSWYRPLLDMTVQRKKLVLIIALCIFLASLMLIPFLGTEFIPTLEEGSILIGVTMAPSISLEKGTELIMQMERTIMGFDEIHETISRIGRPEAGSHPHPVNYAEVHIELKPLNQWKNHQNKKQLIDSLNAALKSYPGVQLNFTQPIQNAFDELLSGIKAQLAVKLYGEDLGVLREKAEEIRGAIDTIPGLVDLSVEQSFGQPQVQVIADRTACARYGITVNEIMELVELAVGGEVIDNIYLNTRRFGIHIRFQEAYRADSESIRNILVSTETGGRIPLSQVAEVRTVTGPIQINREKNQRRWIVQGNIRGRDLGGVVADIKERIAEKIELPPGYTVEYGGQFENQQRAMKRLAIIVPTVVVLVFFMLWITYSSVRYALIIIVNVPLSLIGGILGLFITGEYLSVPASVGFIALFGIAMQDGMVMVSYFNDLRKQGKSIEDAVREGALLRLRPVLVTTVTTVLGLLPLLLATGIGADVQRPLAAVVVFGMTTSTLLTLLIIPAAYSWIENLKHRQDKS
jgi:heavy metal efflux system protein